jgi:hypothetical protein
MDIDLNTLASIESATAYTSTKFFLINSGWRALVFANRLYHSPSDCIQPCSVIGIVHAEHLNWNHHQNAIIQSPLRVTTSGVNLSYLCLQFTITQPSISTHNTHHIQFKRSLLNFRRLFNTISDKFEEGNFLCTDDTGDNFLRFSYPLFTSNVCFRATPFKPCH